MTLPLAKTCNRQKATSKSLAKNCGHTSHDATCSAHVALYLLRTHTTPLGVCRVAGSVCHSCGQPANYCEKHRQTPTCDFLRAQGDGAVGCCAPQDKPGITRMRARDGQFDNDSTGNDTP